MNVTYQDVFGVPLGDEVQESRGLTFTLCPAVKSLRQQLLKQSFFARNAGKVQGTGPLYKPWKGNVHEFNRHHAGLAVDIMLVPTNDTEVALGDHLVLLFQEFGAVMQWRSIIYQDVTLNLDGGVRKARSWTAGDHLDHIHIDWHSDGNVQWRHGINQIPLKKTSGEVIQMPLAQGNQIAESITWTAEAMTVFESEPTFQAKLADLMGKQDRGELKKLNLVDWLGLSGVPAVSAPSELVGKWNVTIGDWSGLFVFVAGGAVSWAEDDHSTKHAGRWTLTHDELQWKFQDVGDFRTFTAPLPISRTSTKGTILPAGQGFFEMKKAT